MQIKDLFTKDINRPINGVVKADQLENNTVFTELDEYVITTELAKHFEEFFDAYMPSVRDPKAKAASGKLGIWVSVFLAQVNLTSSKYCLTFYKTFKRQTVSLINQLSNFSKIKT